MHFFEGRSPTGGDSPEEKWKDVVAQYGHILKAAIVRVAPRNLGLDLDDIAQDARLRLWKTLQSETEITNPASFLYRVAATATLDAVRRAKARREELHADAGAAVEAAASDSPGPGQPAISPDRAVELDRMARQVDVALTKLGANRRRAVGLYLQGFSAAEVAAALRWREPKARNLVYRGLEQLRGYLREEGSTSDVDR